jgi:hypothetical protein
MCSEKFIESGYDNPKRIPITPEMQVAKEAALGWYELREEQIQKLGRFVKVELTARLFSEIVYVIKNKPEFSDFQVFERQDNFLICK